MESSSKFHESTQTKTEILSKFFKDNVLEQSTTLTEVWLNNFKMLEVVTYFGFEFIWMSSYCETGLKYREISMKLKVSYISSYSIQELCSDDSSKILAIYTFKEIGLDWSS